MSRILKYPLDPVRTQMLMMPHGSRMLHAHEQSHVVCVWALCPDTPPLFPRKVTCLSTGVPIPDDAGTYLGTAHLHGGSTVVHVFIEEEL